MIPLLMVVAGVLLVTVVDAVADGLRIVSAARRSHGRHRLAQRQRAGVQYAASGAEATHPGLLIHTPAAGRRWAR